MNHSLPTTNVSFFCTIILTLLVKLEMTSNWQKSNEATYSTDNLSSSIEQLSNNLTTVDLYETQQNLDDFELRKQNLVEEVKENFFFYFLL